MKTQWYEEASNHLLSFAHWTGFSSLIRKALWKPDSFCIKSPPNTFDMVKDEDKESPVPDLPPNIIPLTGLVSYVPHSVLP